ncbi:MAG: glycosyltransferase family 39 protein [Candidatus Omnitrophica bacterium]|nr:glycosyltransferase family 39 protein [Candidatus Omnitrophota bacterium]
MFQSRTDAIVCILIFLLSVFIFTRGLSIHGLEYRDDEIFYFQSTQEMVTTGNIFSPTYFGENRFQKPILYYWLVLFSYKVFGVNWFAARFVAVVFAGLTVCVTWLIGKTLFDRRVATLSAIMLMTIPLFFRHAKNAVPDMPLNFFIVWAIYCAIRFMQGSSGAFGASKEKTTSAKWNILFFVSCALGFMIKGFAALIVPILTVVLYSFWSRKPKRVAEMRFGRGLWIMALIMCPWFFYMIKVHGQEYLNYMLIDETKNRLVNTGGGNVLLKIAATFFDHCLFYLNVIGSYFAPWCFFLIGAVPLAFVRIKSLQERSEGLRLMLVWFFVVFFFFSTMYFSINHYMLVLTSPFAILLGYFFLENVNNEIFIGKSVLFLRKYVPVFILTVACLAFGFLFVFLAGGAKWWLVVLAVVYIVMVREICNSLRLMTAPLILGVFILFVFAQSSLLEKAGVTTHATLQKFAVVVNKELKADDANDAVIGVGSHDIHEKEFQVYFDRKVIKAAGSEEEETKAKLSRLFATDKKVYCLITEEDFDHFLRNSFPGSLEIVKEEHIFRRRMSIDRGFFVALLKLDQMTVRDYLKERIYLIRKSPNA